MAEEHQIEARILLRYDTYSNWMNSTTILKKGEAAIASFPRDRIIEQMSNSKPENTPPAIGIKIGDGTHRFDELPWVQAVAADVYNWAKTSVKPTYTAQEIQGLQSFVENITGGGSGETPTIAPRIYELYEGTGNNANKYYLRYKENNEDSNWILDTSTYIDLNDLISISEWLGSMRENYPNLGTATGTQTLNFIARLDYNDNPVNNYFVTEVNEVDGVISVERAQPSFSNISGTVTVSQGGTGKTSFNEDEVLVGNGTEIKTVPIADSIANNYNLVPNYLVKQYVDSATSGITGAMHFKGEATVQIVNGSSINPQINDYNFSKAEPGDVILGTNKEEYVWTGSNWRLLGDEGSYAVKGSITNADIADEANISISKIYNLSDLLNTKVDKVDGKSLSTNDFTTEYKQKLDDIEENAQRNLIEHIYINGTEAIPSVIDGKANSLAIRLSSLTPEEEEKLRGIEQNAQVNTIEHVFLNEEELAIKTVKTLPKSVNIELIPYTEQEQQKLADIQAGAQVNTIQSISINGVPVSPTADKVVDIVIPDHAEHANKIEKIFLNGVEQVPDSDKYINIQIDESAVSFTVLKGARVPTGIPATPYEDIDLDETTKKLEFAKIAKTGWVYDIVNTPANNTTDYLILRCGDSTTLVD